MTAVVPALATFEDWRPGWGPVFAELNCEWIENLLGFLEPEDIRVLADPEGTIIAIGGVILFAVLDGTPVATGALIPIGRGEYELAKMAVAPMWRGQGIGRRLAERLIARGRELGATRIELLSQTALPRAVPLYRKLGFREIPMGEQVYERANIRMELRL
ncbi:MAG: GNAT family N-acetyltransferase [Gemmatimonadales bacterium]